MKEQIAKTFLTLESTPEGKAYLENVGSEKFVQDDRQGLRHHSRGRRQVRQRGRGRRRRARVRRLIATCAATMPLALEVRNLRAGYAGREILKGVSFDVAPDDFFAIIGPSGAGKSTLIRCVNRLVEPTGGESAARRPQPAALGQQQLREARRNIGMIFQEFNLIERLSVLDNVLTGRSATPGRCAASSACHPRDIGKALSLLDRVGLREHVDKRPTASRRAAPARRHRARADAEPGCCWWTSRRRASIRRSRAR
jgi:ABC-type ATPase involved in cell division